MKEITDTLLSTKLFTEILRSLALSSEESSSSLILRKKQPTTHKTIKPTHNSMIAAKEVRVIMNIPINGPTAAATLVDKP